MMKNQKMSVLLLFVVFGMSLSLGSCSKDKIDPDDNDDPNAEVVFEDASLASFIKEELALSASDKITKADLAELTSLNIRGALTAVTSLKGLEHATELTLLDFGGNGGITDLTPIKDLKKITYLRMNETGVTSLVAISEYTTLRYFNANQANPGISDLSPLSKNIGMQTMILRGQPLDNASLQAISDFTGLYRLNIRDTEVTDLSVIESLMGKGAFLKTTPGSDGLGTDAMLDLQGLTINNCEVIDSYRDNFAGPVNGACSGPTVVEPEPGEDNDVVVPFTNNQNVADVINIVALGRATGTPITRGDLRGLTGELNLQSIVGDLTSIEGLEYTVGLTRFNANGNDIGQDRSKLTSLAPLINNTNLERIIVRNQPLGNEGIAVIINFKKLDRMNLRNTGVTDLSVFATLLKEGVPITNLDLQQLNITNCSVLVPYLSQITSYAQPTCLPE